MIDIASFVLCGFQDMIVSAFGSSLGWLVGHLIVLGLVCLTYKIFNNRQHIISQSPWDASTLKSIAIFIVLTAVQYYIFTNTFGFPTNESIGLAAVSSILIRWHILVLG
ncbi:MAG: hypothetical protein CXT72_01740 [Methanobacteriota archaeon]|jgi:hypothetical protein|nr:MAG: hypothetical protein CXT72_01740 [Euryarchaeota archaeon]HIE63498.1 hypothetical protein [Candidatus Poseidoniales archaeon]HIL00217.1 hypothetical protein [Candidatus Poseidoniales archaeon]